MDREEFAQQINMPFGKYGEPPDLTAAHGFDVDLVDEVAWAANDGGDYDGNYAALVRQGGWFYRIEGWHDSSGWG